MENINTEEQKRLFKDWLQNSRKISQSTLIAYTEDILFKLKEIITHSNNEKVKSLNPNMYSYQTKAEFDYFVNIIKNDPNFDVIIKTGKAQSGWGSTPLNHYGKFLVQNGNDNVNFTWIPFYKEFANKLLEYQNNRQELINKIKDIFLRMSNLTLPTLERDNNIIDIDPFTVFGLFNKGITNNNRLELISLIKESFNINADIPKDFNGIPVLNNQRSTFYYFIGDRSDNDINNLWELFKVAMDYEKNSLPIWETKFDNIFNTVKGQQGVKWNITMGLFWISPYMYINLDSKNRTVLQNESFILSEVKQKLKDFGNSLPTGKDYIYFCKQLRSELANNKNGINDFPAFSFYADKTINYTINDDDFNDKEIDEMNIPLNQILYGPPGTGKTYNTFLKAMSIIDGIEYKEVSGDKYDELKTSFDYLKQAGQIEFVTFHQSYSYEEFVEGIKPDLENNELKYKLEDGIFKRICEHARPIVTKSIKRAPIDFANTKVFKMSLGNTLAKEDDIYNYCIENNVVSLGWKDADFSSCKTRKDFQNIDSSWGATALERFVKWMDIGDIIIISNGNKNFRAVAQVKSNYIYNPNTPISHSHFREVEWLYVGDDIYYSKINDKIFSQQSIYGYFESANRGLNNYNPDLKTDELNKIITGEVNEEELKPHILIIDEINRGNISKIFGELITLIEEDKRENLTVTLPYSHEPFTVPKNLYIVGTMNTSDRSIASIDIALRRRFKFVEMMPNVNLVPDIKVFNFNLRDIFEKLNNRISVLLDRDHQIGHSYFMPLENSTTIDEDFKDIWFDSILPLLNEYFYNDWEKLCAILGKPQNNGNSFIKKINNVSFADEYSCDDTENYDFISKNDKVLNFKFALENAFIDKTKKEQEG